MSRIQRNARNRIIRVFDDDEFAYRLAEAHRTILEFYVISAAIKEMGDDWRSRFGLALGGRDLPEEAGRSSAARDAQFELLVAALIYHSGIRDIVCDEPDIRIKAGTKWMGVAAKRVTGRSQLLKRLRSASKQIQGQGSAGVEYGIIALNLDRAIGDMFLASGIEEARREFDTITLAGEQFVRARPESRCVAGVQTFATIVGWDDTDGIASLGVEVMTHGRWVSPEAEVRPLGAFLRNRGAQLERELGRLLGSVA